MTKITIEPKPINEVAIFDKFETQLAEYKKKYEGIVYDFSDEDQKQSAKEDKKTLSKTVKVLDETHKEAKADLLVKTRLLDGERKRIKDSLLELKEAITNQEEEYANIAIKHAAKLNDLVESINNYAVFDDGVTATKEDLLTRIKLTNEATVNDKFESREADGHMAKAKTLELLQGKLLVMEAKEKEAEEQRLAAEKAQQEREEQIRKDAEAKAEQEKKELEQQARLEAEKAKEQAKIDKENAIKAEKEKAKKAELEAERAKAQAVRAEQERMKAEQEAKEDKVRQEAAELKKKQENKAHQKKINNEAKASLLKLKSVDDAAAIEIITAIAKGQIKNIFIQY